MEYLNFGDRVKANVVIEFVLLLIDLSGSMKRKDWSPSRRIAAMQACEELINKKSQYYPDDWFGIIGFGSYAEILHKPVCISQGYKSLKEPASMGSTNFNAALKLAGDCFFPKKTTSNTKPQNKGIITQFFDFVFGADQQENAFTAGAPSNSDCLKRIIMLTDGGWNTGGSPMRTASRLKDAGVVIDCIGIASKKDVNEEDLKKIASRNPDGSVRYCWIGSKKELIKKYESLAHHIKPA